MLALSPDKKAAYPLSCSNALDLIAPSFQRSLESSPSNITFELHI